MRANNRRIIREHTAARKAPQNKQLPSSSTAEAASDTSEVTSEGMYNYQPENDILPSRSVIPDDDFERFINKHGKQLVETDSLPQSHE